MFSLKDLLFKGTAPAHLADELRAAVEAWRASRAPDLDDAHFHVRYVVVDIASTALQPDSDELLGIAAAGLRRAGRVQPDDAFYLDLAGRGDDTAALDRQLLAFLQFAAKGPLVTYHVPYVGGFLQRVYKARLGIDFQPQWVDLAWLLPTLFDEKSHAPLPLDRWLALLGLQGEEGERRDAMENTLMLARIFQMLLVRAGERGIGTAARLVEESRASSFLRRNH